MEGKRWLAGAVAAAMLLSAAPAYAFAGQLDEPAAADESALECTKVADCPAQEHEPDCPAAQVPQPEPNAALTEENAEPDAPTGACVSWLYRNFIPLPILRNYAVSDRRTLEKTTYRKPDPSRRCFPVRTYAGMP